MNEIQIDKGERPSSPTHAGEEININNTKDCTEPNVLGAAPLFASVDGGGLSPVDQAVNRIGKILEDAGWKRTS